MIQYGISDSKGVAMQNKTFKSRDFKWGDGLAEWVNESIDTITVVSIVALSFGSHRLRVYYWED